jgi:hypothetical protein
LLEKVSRLQQFISIVEIANKYHFVSLGSWALKTLKEVFGQTTVSPIYHERILRIAMLCDKDLCGEFVSKLSAGLMDGSLAPTEALIIADQLQIRELLGVAYYAQLVALQKNNSDTIAFPAGCPLSKDQRIRLLAGHWSLGRRWERLRDTPVNFVQSPSCHDHQYCRTRWENQWHALARAQCVTQHPSADVLGRMQAMLDLLQACFSRQNVSNPPQQISPVSHPNPVFAHQNVPTLQNLASQQNLPVQQNWVAYQNTPAHPPHLQMFMASAQGRHAVHLCTKRALDATKEVSDNIRASLLDFFSEDALGLTQGPM